jgi:predicted RNase H-like HicB family nuclease
MQILILVEPSDSGFSAYAPDVPGCVAAALTRGETEVLMQEALTIHFEGLREDGRPVPQAGSYATFVEVTIPA